MVLRSGETVAADFVVLAVPFDRVSSFLSDSMADSVPSLSGLGSISASPITGIHLWFDRPVCPFDHVVTIGRQIRNSMAMWLVYSTIFGLMMRVDHSAHVTGFALGFLLGFTSHGVQKRRGSTDAILGLVGFVVLLALLALILFPPDPMRVMPWVR